MQGRGCYSYKSSRSSCTYTSEDFQLLWRKIIMTTLAEKREDAAERKLLSEILLVACDQSYNTAPPLHMAPFSDSNENGGPDIAPNAMPETWSNLRLNDWILDRRF